MNINFKISLIIQYKKYEASIFVIVESSLNIKVNCICFGYEVNSYKRYESTYWILFEIQKPNPIPSLNTKN